MTLSANEFMRRFLLHVLPAGFHRIRYTGLIANNRRKERLALARELLCVVAPMTVNELGKGQATTSAEEPIRLNFVCRQCGALMIVLETFIRGVSIRAPPSVRGEA